MPDSHNPYVVPEADWATALARIIVDAPGGVTVWVRSDSMKELAIRAAQRVSRQDLHFEILPEPNREWDLTAMTPQALAAAKPGSGPKCPNGQHSSGWYVGYACTRCGDVD